LSETPYTFRNGSSRALRTSLTSLVSAKEANCPWIHCRQCRG
jgi:hypothetical protein